MKTSSPQPQQTGSITVHTHTHPAKQARPYVQEDMHTRTHLQQVVLKERGDRERALRAKAAPKQQLEERQPR
jgi:hypothetical protein